ncbi:uncharacterized protein LOC110715444 [Chenopodium quinoa]|uniref:uncharacterized protein LOC110715444 n=1 Tax=Chenopodium quinoa TaxID=63459 RepID=UPI000B782864|nr:uncharacterized protein LOC110715444 [Chenopodium quinoa]
MVSEPGNTKVTGLKLICPSFKVELIRTRQCCEVFVLRECASVQRGWFGHTCYGALCARVLLFACGCGLRCEVSHLRVLRYLISQKAATVSGLVSTSVFTHFCLFKGAQSNRTFERLTDADRRSVPTITNEQWKELLSVVQCSSSSSIRTYNSVDWLINTGASNHMSGNIDLFTNLSDISSPVCLPNGKSITATKEGRVIMSYNLTLHNVLYNPALKCNLLSGSQLLEQQSYSVMFTDKLCIIQDRSLRNLIGAGEQCDGVYIFRPVRARNPQANKVGPNKIFSSCDAQYFLTIVDDFSRSTWVFLMTQFGRKVKVVRSDNGQEFLSLGSFFAKKGILHQTSCVDTAQQNGRVERKHRHILNVARALRFQAKLPKYFWGECVMTAVHLINRTPTSILKGKTPHELLFGQSPFYDSLRVFGCLAYTANRPWVKDKFDSRSRKCIFVGYPHGKKGWRLYDLETNEFFVSRDVQFFEDKFPYLESLPDERRLLWEKYFANPPMWDYNDEEFLVNGAPMGGDTLDTTSTAARPQENAPHRSPAADCSVP